MPIGGTKLADYAPRKSIFANGLRLVSERRPGTGIVALELYVDAGQVREAKPGLAYLTGRMLEEGTTSRSAEALAEAIEDIGGMLDVCATGATLRVPSEELALALEMLADMVLGSAFLEDALPWVKRRIAADLQGDRDDPAFRADLLFRGLVYGAHPYGRDPRGTVRDLARLSLDDVRRTTPGTSRPTTRFSSPWAITSRGAAAPGQEALSNLGRGGLAVAPLPRVVRATRPASAAWRIRANRCKSCSAIWGSCAPIPSSTPWPFSTTSSAADRASPIASAGSFATKWAWPTRSAAG